MKDNNQPHIVIFTNDEADDAQYFIAIEKMLVMESSNVTAAVFYLMAAHYVLNLGFHPKARDLFTFMQEKVLGLPSKKKNESPVILTHTAEKYLIASVNNLVDCFYNLNFLFVYNYVTVNVTNITCLYNKHHLSM